MANIKNLTGSKIGKLTLLERKRENNKTYYYCKCECGNEKWIRADTLNRDSSCGCNRKYKFRDLTGMKFGMLEAIEVVSSSTNNGHIWKCKCDCGKYKNVAMSTLVSGTTKSCGCYQKEKAKQNIQKAHEIFAESNLVENTNISLLTPKKLIKTNKSGVNGVCFIEKEQRWKAYIGFQKKKYYLGYFNSKEEAISIRKEAEQQIHGKFLEWYNENKKGSFKNE